ncbi:hypothetical protein ABPG77_008104 [Micractinium sp. CCAP 211/92]
MGSGRDKRKKKTGKKPGGGDAKTERKTEKNEEKKSRRLERAAQGGEDDIDALLAKFKLQDERHSAVSIKENCAAPSPRVYASFTPIPSQARRKENEVILYGGEWYDSDKDKTHVYSDIYVLNVDKLTWRRVVSPNGCAGGVERVHPAAAHQPPGGVHAHGAVGVGWRVHVLNQEKFRHYGDLWRLNLEDWSWEQIPAREGPAPAGGEAPLGRAALEGWSGHRMVLWGKKMILFGGFYDSGKETITPAAGVLLFTPLPGHPTDSSLTPSPASSRGCQLALNGDQLFIVGGFSVKKEEQDKDSFAPKRKKGDDDDRMAPNPRTAFGLVTHKKRAVMFGGILDQEGQGGDRLYSELFNELYQFNMESRRWFPRMLADKGGALHAAAARIQANYRGYRVRQVGYKTYRLGGQISELLYSPATYGVDFSSKDLIKPRARAAPMLCVSAQHAVDAGRPSEISHTDIVLDDIWCLDLNKLDGWKCVRENTVGEDAFKELSSDEWETESESE